MTQARVSGRIVIYGTPAEEVDPPAKGIMWRAGVFKGADILVRSHSTVETRRDRPGFGVCCLNIDAVKYTFTGRPAHQLSAWNGRNALEAAVQFYSAVDHLRSTWRSEHRVQGVIPEGGIAPNVVPDHTVVDYFIRFPDEVYLEHIARMMDDAAKGAAQMRPRSRSPATASTAMASPCPRSRSSSSRMPRNSARPVCKKRRAVPLATKRPDG